MTNTKEEILEQYLASRVVKFNNPARREPSDREFNLAVDYAALENRALDQSIGCGPIEASEVPK